MSSDNALRILNDLIQVGRDAEQGYQTAANGVSDPELGRIFGEYAAQRAKSIFELQQRVRILRGDPEKEGTVVGAIHRELMALAAALASDELHTVLAEVERGEDLAVSAYRAALKEQDIDNQTQQLVQRQYEAVQAAHDRIRQLRDSAIYAHR